MPTIEFLGFVIPREKTLNAHGTLDWKDGNIRGQLRYRIVEAMVSAEFEVEMVSPAIFEYAYTLAFYQVRGAINAITFSSGIGFTLIFERGVQPSRDGPLVIHRPELAALCTLSSQEVLDAITRERRLIKPLNDISEALLYPLEAFVNCARCIDGLCHLMSPEKKREKRWECLRNNLNLTKDFLNFVMSGSAELRHGDTPPQSLVDIAEATSRTWKVMARFLEFRKRGNVPLSISDFEIL